MGEYVIFDARIFAIVSFVKISVPPDEELNWEIDPCCGKMLIWVREVTDVRSVTLREIDW